MLNVQPLTIRLTMFSEFDKKFRPLRESMLRDASCIEIRVNISPTALTRERMAEDDDSEGDFDESPEGEDTSPYKLAGLPDPYVLPIHNIPQFVKKSVANGERLTKTHVSAITTALYEDVTSYVYYPSPKQYDNIINALMD